MNTIEQAKPNEQEVLKQAINAIKSGNKQSGKWLLQNILQENPGNETAWIWLSNIADSDDEQRECLKRVLAINPNNQEAQKELATLKMGAIFIQSSCPNCGKSIKGENKFCNFCGFDLRPNIAVKQQCPSCGVSVSADSSFCANCGTRLVIDIPIDNSARMKSVQQTPGTTITDKTAIVNEIGSLEEKIVVAETQFRQYEREFAEAKENERNSSWGALLGLGIAIFGIFFFGGTLGVLIGVGFGALSFVVNIFWSFQKNNLQKKMKIIEEEIANNRVTLGKLRAKLAI